MQILTGTIKKQFDFIIKILHIWQTDPHRQKYLRGCEHKGAGRSKILVGTNP